MGAQTAKVPSPALAPEMFQKTMENAQTQQMLAPQNVNGNRVLDSGNAGVTCLAPALFQKVTGNTQTQQALAPQNFNWNRVLYSENAGVKALADAASKSSPVTTTPPTESSYSVSNKKTPPLRRGKWTAEEEAYANRLIQEFKAGLLPLNDGTTLRTFLSTLLNCDPMRISKKLVGSNCIGKQVFRRRTAEINMLSPDQIKQSRAELSELERRFLERLAQTNRVKTSGGAVAYIMHKAQS